MPETTPPPDARPWWGPWELPRGRTGQWRIGPLTLRLIHLEGEWRAHVERGSDPVDPTLEMTVPLAEEPELPAAQVTRFALATRSGAVALRPALADRPVVVRPDMPFTLLPHEETRLFLTTPVWVQVHADGERLLLDVPAYRPSDTWLGPNTREGVLGYAGRTLARLSMDGLQIRPARAATVVRLRNDGADSMRVDRFSLPVPHLPLFADAEHRLWTPHVTVERRADGALAGFDVGREPPPEAGDTVEVAAPRARADRNFLFRAFSALLD